MEAILKNGIFTFRKDGLVVGFDSYSNILLYIKDLQSKLRNFRSMLQAIRDTGYVVDEGVIDDTLLEPVDSQGIWHLQEFPIRVYVSEMVMKEMLLKKLADELLPEPVYPEIPMIINHWHVNQFSTVSNSTGMYIYLEAVLPEHAQILEKHGGVIQRFEDGYELQ